MSDQQLLRYSRHILLNEIGIEGQERLLGGQALIIGMGGQPKAASAQAALHDINPEVECTTLPVRADEEQLFKQIARADVVLDGSDNFDTRYAINRACLTQRKPLSINALDSSLARYPHCRVCSKSPPDTIYSDPVDGTTRQHYRNGSYTC